MVGPPASRNPSIRAHIGMLAATPGYDRTTHNKDLAQGHLLTPSHDPDYETQPRLPVMTYCVLHLFIIVILFLMYWLAFSIAKKCLVLSFSVTRER